MNDKFLYIFSFSLISLLWNPFNAQNKTIEITGKVMDAVSNQPIEYATISILDKSTNTPITGTVSNMEGHFAVNTDAENFYIEISYIGYTTKTFKTFSISKNTVDLKVVVLSEDLQALGEVIVRAEKSQTEFKLDKRIFNVGSDLSSTGASALEVLNNVPSVNVSIEGVVSLRGSQGVQILINGKRTNHKSITLEKFKKNNVHWLSNHPAVCFRKKQILDLGGYNEKNIGHFEDFELQLKILKKYGIIHNIPHVLLKYRTHPDQITSKNIPDKDRILNKLIKDIIYE